MLNISGLENGVVLDHIPAGKGMDIYKYLKLEQYDSQVAIIKNATSSKMGKKDIIKISGDTDKIDVDAIGFIDPNITVNVIRNGSIIEKKRLTLPKKLTNIIKCKNPRCITTAEPSLPQEFRLVNRDQRIYRCCYCDTEYKEK